MKKTKWSCTLHKRHFSVRLLTSYFFLCSLFLYSCSGDDPQSTPKITGGHQVYQADGNFEFRFGIFDASAQPSTTFEAGEDFILSFWVENNTSQMRSLLQSEYPDFFRVYRLEEPDTRIDLGQPHTQMFCVKVLGIQNAPNNAIKFELAWTTPENVLGQIDDGTLWCGTNNQPPLPPGSYRTEFVQSFDFHDGERVHSTIPLSFSIDFEVR